MAEDGKIYITISDERKTTGSSGTIPQAASSQTDDSKGTGVVGKYAAHQFFNFIESEAKTMVSYSLSNIGNFTGDYQTQRSVNNTLSALNMAKNVVSATVAGFSMGGVIGAGVGAVISVATMATNYYLQENSSIKANKIANNEIALLKEKSGLNSLTNGSR